jgi:Tfp pilus assembly protein PilO
MKEVFSQLINLRRVSTRERMLIAAAGLTAVLFIGTKWLVFPFLDSVSDLPATVNSQTKRMVNYRRVLLGTDSVRAALEAAQKQTAVMESGLLSGRTSALANAELQGLVKEMALGKGLTLRRSDSAPSKAVSLEYEKVSIRVEFQGNIDQLVGLLAAMETSPRILFLEEIRVTPISYGNPKNKQVNSTLTISAIKYLDTGGVSAGPKT